MQPSWYWAACIQMIYNDKDMSYDRIYFINRIKGAPDVNQPNIGLETLESIKSWNGNSKGRIFLLPPKSELDTIFHINNLFSLNWPLGKIQENSNRDKDHASRVNIFYYKKNDALGDVIDISLDKVILRVLWTQNSSKYDFSVIDSESKLKSVVQVYIL